MSPSKRPSGSAGRRGKWIPLLLVSAAVFAVCGSYLVERDLASASWPRPYRTLYDLADRPRIAGFDLRSDALGLRVEGLASDAWTVESRTDDASRRAHPELSVPLRPGLHDYEIAGVPASAGESTTPKFGVTTLVDEDDRVVLVSASLPIVRDARYELNDFVVPREAYDATERAGARELLASLGIDESQPTVEKIEAIAAGLWGSLIDKGGAPQPFMRQLTPWQQYQAALRGDSRVYCANIARIYAFVANECGVPTRLVDAAGSLDGVALSAHAFTESYVPERGEWAYVDATLGVFLIRTPSGSLVDGAELLHHGAAGTTAELSTTDVRTGVVRHGPFDAVSEFVRAYLHPDVDLVYHWADRDLFSISARLARWIWNPEPSYSLGRDSAGVLLRMGMWFAGAVLAVLWAVIAGRRVASALRRGRGSSAA